MHVIHSQKALVVLSQESKINSGEDRIVKDILGILGGGQIY